MNNSAHVCGTEHARWLDNGFRHLVHNPERMFGPYVNKGGTILDIGCGPGTFTLGLARLAGKGGRVIAVDLQEEMLGMARKKIVSAGMLDQVMFHRCTQESLNLDIKADFIVTFYMVHESPDPCRLIDQICTLLKPGGYYYLAEPKFHVSETLYRKMQNRCKEHGLSLIKKAGIVSRIAVFKKTV